MKNNTNMNNFVTCPRCNEGVTEDEWEMLWGISDDARENLRSSRGPASPNEEFRSCRGCAFVLRIEMADDYEGL